MISTIENRDWLDNIKGREGDVVIVNENGYERSYYKHLGHWIHEKEYECPIRNSIFPEPNA